MGKLWRLKRYQPFRLDFFGPVLYTRQCSSYTVLFVFKTNTVAAFSPILQFLSIFQNQSNW